ncbi:MAG: Penicillin-binding protein 2 [Microgenomates group bacterium GW2011_GWA2_37_6]|nr:MAG: Penicillin-binding protein 2 [Microgenomates group bacterium GW2011_GWA2_37_6]
MEKIGPVFGEFITTEKIKRRGNYHGEKDFRGMRIYLGPLVIGVIILVILLRLFFIQIVQGNYYRSLSDTNRIKTIVVNAPRGIIFDRNKKPLVFNIPGFRQKVKGETLLIGREEAIALIAEGKKDFEIDSLRDYPYKDAMSHLLGYIGQISKEELRASEFSSYKSGDVVGKIGIERQYEGLLKGEDGKQLAEIDSMGKVIRKLGETDPVPGRNIILTIDADLQKKAFESLKNVKKGAVIVSTPKGEILALVSKPSFDPNLFTQGEDYSVAASNAAVGPVYKNVSEILNASENQPFLNRAIGGLYPPGSTFKLITAAAGLENGLIDTSYSVKDTGIVRLGTFSFANWYFTNYGGTDGEVNVVKAIKRSNDIFFYKLAEKVGVERLSEMARKFRVDKALGIDLEGETKGLVPTDEWKRKNIGEQWFLGDTYNYGIGQGYLLATPLEVNSWAQIIANNGTLYRPYIFKDLGAKKLNNNFLSSKTVNPIRQGMIEACQAGGVAWPLFDFKVKNPKLKIDGRNFLKVATGSADFRQVVVACKTGTAQHGGEHTLPHAWITLFAPAYDPKIVVTVLAEESGEGSNVAAPIAKKILEEWFSKK